MRIRTRNAIEERRNFRGRLLGCTEGVVQIEVEGEILDIPLSNVARANLEFEL